METKKNVISIISDGYFGDDKAYDVVTVVDSKNGEILFSLDRVPYWRIMHKETNKTLVSKIELKFPKRKRGGKFGNLDVELMRLIDGETRYWKPVSIAWVERWNELSNKNGNIKLRFKKGSIKCLKEAEKRCAKCDAEIIGERTLNKTSYYDDDFICIEDTIKFYFVEDKTTYNAQDDWFAFDCLKIGLPLRKYKAEKIKDKTTKEVITEICNDLGYNLLNVVMV